MYPRTLWFSIAAILTICVSEAPAYQESTSSEIWYPFIKGDKWGFIDCEGHWKIQPSFDRVCDIFDHDMVRVWIDNKCGYIDRSGAWVVKPEFDMLSPYFAEADLQAVGHNKKMGVLNRLGQLILPLRYDGVVLSSDRAWVRSGDRLGVFGLDGKWIHPLTIPWPSGRSMPSLLNSDHLAWYQDNQEANGKCGLIDSGGKTLFRPRFEYHRLGRHEGEEWNHPYGIDFHDGKAWAFENGSYELITSDGTIIKKEPFGTMTPWSGNLSLFTENNGAKVGLISSSGDIVFPAVEGRIEKPIDGLAKYTVYKSSPESFGGIGFLGLNGKPFVPAGKYGRLHDPSEGLIAASKQAARSQGTNMSDPRGVFLDLKGQDVLLTDDNFYAVDSFSDGVAAVCEVKETGKGTTPEGGKWGYIDRTGAVKIPLQFGWATRFCRGRAWIAQQSDYSESGDKYALIDESGKVLTDYRFYPPERSHSAGEYLSTAKLPDVRWRGSLVVLDSGWRIGLGLASADGRILIAPKFNALNPLSDGMIGTITLKGEDRWTGYVNDKGEEVIAAIYTGGTDFEKGSAWVTKQPNDHKVIEENQGWVLIDHQGQVLTKDSYLNPSFIVEAGYRDFGGLVGVPQFIGDIACVASAKTYQLYGDERLKHLSWGYVNRAGQVVAWHPSEAK